MVSSITINQDTVHCDPSEPQTEFNDPESDKLLISVSLSLILDAMLPRILSSVTYLPENKQDDSRKVLAIGSKMRHSIVSPEELSRNGGWV